MILVHLKNGQTVKLNAANKQDCVALDHSYNQKGISRIALLNDKGGRLDLPIVRGRSSRVWLETINNGKEIRGERVGIRNGRLVMRASVYFSDGRFVLDLS